MAKKLVGLGIALLSGWSALLGGCSSPGAAESVTEGRAFGLDNGDPASASEGTFVVSLGADCSGVMLSPYAILTASHCIDNRAKSGADASVETKVIQGSGNECLTRDSAGNCATWSFAVHRHPDADLALLTTGRPLPVDSTTRFPWIGLNVSPAEITAWGFGVGSFTDGSGEHVSVAVGSRLLHTDFQVSQALWAQLEADSGVASVCDGDSGGPATFESDGNTVVAGILRASEADPVNPRCTKPGGRQVWLRPGAFMPFIQSVLGACQTTTNSTGQTLASCQGKPLAATTRFSVSDFVSSQPGISQLDGVSTSVASKNATADQFESISLITDGVVHQMLLDKGDLVQRFGTIFSGTQEFSKPAVDAMLLKSRGWSQGDDRRFRITGSQAPEAGRLLVQIPLDDGTTRFNYCTATLIGRRILRTAAHCLMFQNPNAKTVAYYSNIRFNFEQDGNPAAAAVDTTSAEFGGNFVPNSCYKGVNSSNLGVCLPADWGLVILPSNAWDSLGYTPGVMGYRTLTQSDLNKTGTSVGYPQCGLSNSPSGCVDGYKYATTDTFECKIFSFTNGTLNFRTGCDISAGDSGGPFYDPSTRTLLGTAQYEVCTTCAGTSGLDFYAPNYFEGSDSYLVSEQNRLNSVYP